MEIATHHDPAAADLAGHVTAEKKANAFTALRDETRVVVDTATAAHHLNRQPQTLRVWACMENGPLRPVRVHGRLAWSVSDLRTVLGVA